MRKINLICVGSLKEDYLKSAVAEYKKRISKFFELNIIEIPEAKIQKKNAGDISSALSAEGDKILEKIKGKVLILAIEGEAISSVEFAKLIENETNLGEISFVIGSSFGLDKAVKSCGKMISFGKITLPHQLMRVVLLEQIYRAGTILNGIEYHK